MAEKTSDLYDKAMSMSSSLDGNFMDLARVVRELNQFDLDEFKKFCAKSRIGKRRAYCLVSIDKAFRKLPISRDRLHRIGWTKVYLLSQYINETNASKLVGWAEVYTVRELEAMLKGEVAVPNAHSVLFYFNEKDYETLQKALVKYGATRSNRGLVGKEQALVKLLKKEG